ncbi:MAG: hypothetical protein ABEK01_01185 [Candidatus Nanohaloarchaea archaeon]
MGLKERIQNLFSSGDSGEIEFEPEEAVERFREEREKELRRARRRAEELSGKTDDLMDRLEEDLEEVREYEDVDDIDLVEDVARDFYRKRKNMLEKFEPSEKLEDQREELRDFVEDFNDVTRKQGAVMKRIQKSSGTLSGTIDEIMEHADRLDDFMESEYSAIRQRKEIERIQKTITDIEDEIEDLKQDIEDEDTEKLEEELEKVRESIEDLKESEKWERKEELEEELEYLEEKKEDRLRDISLEKSKMERGLKKMLYEIDEGDGEFDGEVQKLRRIKDERFESIQGDLESTLDSAVDFLEEKELIDDRQLKKFREAADSLSNLDSRTEEIQEYRDRIEEAREVLEELEVQDELEELEKEKDKVQQELEDRRRKIEEKKEQLEDLREKKEKRIEELEDKLDSYIGPAVSIED